MCFTFTCVNCVLTGGPPDDVNNVFASLTACGLIVQWSESSSDPVCGTVWYTVTVSTEGGILIITDNTTMTNYSVTGLNNNVNTVYHVNVTASNDAGSSDPIMVHQSSLTVLVSLYAFSCNYIMYHI